MKNILLVSQDADESTIDVMDWLRNLGFTPLRLNFENLNEKWGVTIHISNNKINVELSYENKPVVDIGSIWYRRHRSLISLGDILLKNSFYEQIANHLKKESKSFEAALLGLLLQSGVRWIGNPFSSVINKINVLTLAQKVGLNIPNTLISNKKTPIADFANNNLCITKSIGDADCFKDETNYYILYTEKLPCKLIDDIPATIFPSIVQQEVIKTYEIRAFFLENKIYSMAIFSQNDNQTKTDFRKYNYNRWNRCVPYKIPNDVETKICDLMKLLNLNSGSLDLIRAADGKYVFLEINPVGQFGMVSYPCNYNIEKEIAIALTNRMETV